jgi:hypothetical protein
MEKFLKFEIKYQVIITTPGDCDFDCDFPVVTVKSIVCQLGMIFERLSSASGPVPWPAPVKIAFSPRRIFDDQ